MSRGKLVYSSSQPVEKKKENQKVQVAEGPLKIRLEKKGRGGKSVTVLFNLPFPEEDAKRLLSQLQSFLSCGGTYKNGQIELRGDVRDRLCPWLTKKEITFKLAGG